jgi:hypothetical protein
METTRIILTVSTDRIGEEAHNTTLSQPRAENSVKALK